MIDTARPVATSPAVVIAENTTTFREETASWSFVLRNHTATASVFLGGTQAEAEGAESFEWRPADGPLDVTLEPGETLYGYATTPQTLHRIKAGR